MTHRVLVVGAGSIGERHIRCLLRTGRAAVGVCEPMEARRDQVAATYGLEHKFADPAGAFAAGWDAVVIATPAPLHVPLALAAADAGAHLLIEKPLALDDEDVPRLQRLVEEKRLIAGVAYVYRAHPALEAMRAAVLERRFGEPVQLVVVAGQHFPHHRPAYRHIYYADRAQGGGAIQDALTHLVNAAEWLVGPVRRVLAQADHLVLDGVEVEDTVHALASHDQVMACYSLNQHQAPNDTLFRVVCTRGTCDFLPNRHAWRWMTEPDGAWHDQPAPIVERDDWFTLQAQAFLDALERRRAPLCTLEEGLQTLRVNRAILASADAGGAWQRIAADHEPARKEQATCP